MGADVDRHQAASGDVWPEYYQVDGTFGDVGLSPGCRWADLGAGGRGFESRHPDGYFSNMLSGLYESSRQARLLLGVA